MDPEALQQLMQQFQGAQGANAAGGAAAGDANAMLSQMQQYAGFVMLISVGLVVLFIARGIYKAVKMHKLKTRIQALELEVAELRVKVNATSYGQVPPPTTQPSPAETYGASNAPSPQRTQSEEKTW